MRRRNCLKGLGTASGIVLAPWVFAKSTRRIERPGLQLYTVRDAMANDVAATLAAVAQAGYVEVETAGLAELSPAQFAQALGNAGLAAPSAHVPLQLMAERPDELLASAAEIGYQYLVLPWLAPEQRSLDGYTKTIEVLNRFGEQCAGAGVQLCYHNHDFEFQRLEGVVPFDLLLKECHPQYVRFEMDLYWVAHAGVDATAYLRTDPQRFPLCHVKDRSVTGDMVDVGKGVIDFPTLFAAGTAFAHYFVEHDRPTDSLISIRDSIRVLREMRF